VGPCREVIVVKRTVTLLTERVSNFKASALGNLTLTMSPRKVSLIGILDLASKVFQAAENWSERLFIKNTGLC